MKLPQTGADARVIRECKKLTQSQWAEAFGFSSRESISKIEAQESLTRMQSWFYWYVKKFGTPEEGEGR